MSHCDSLRSTALARQSLQCPQQPSFAIVAWYWRGQGDYGTELHLTSPPKEEVAGYKESLGFSTDFRRQNTQELAVLLKYWSAYPINASSTCCSKSVRNLRSYFVCRASCLSAVTFLPRKQSVPPQSLKAGRPTCQVRAPHRWKPHTHTALYVVRRRVNTSSDSRSPEHIPELSI